MTIFWTVLVALCLLESVGSPSAWAMPPQYEAPAPVTNILQAARIEQLVEEPVYRLAAADVTAAAESEIGMGLWFRRTCQHCHAQRPHGQAVNFQRFREIHSPTQLDAAPGSLAQQLLQGYRKAISPSDFAEIRWWLVGQGMLWQQRQNAYKNRQR